MSGRSGSRLSAANSPSRSSSAWRARPSRSDAAPREFADEPGESFAEPPEIVGPRGVGPRDELEDAADRGRERLDPGDRLLESGPPPVRVLAVLLPLAGRERGEIGLLALAESRQPFEVTVPAPADHGVAQKAAGRTGRESRPRRAGRKREIAVLEKPAELVAREVAGQPGDQAEEEPAGRSERDGDPVPEGDGQARPGGEEMEDGGVVRSRRRQDLHLIEGHFFGVETAQDLAALVGRAERPEDLDPGLLFGRGLARGEKPGEPAGAGKVGGARSGPGLAGPVQADDGIAGDEDQTAGRGGPDQLGFETAQPGIQRREDPRGCERPLRRGPDRPAEKAGQIEQAVVGEGRFVAGQDQGELPALAFDQELSGAEVGARPAVEPELPDGPVKGHGQSRRSRRPAEVLELAGGQELPEQTVGQSELRRRGHGPGRARLARPLQDLGGQHGRRDEAEVDP